MTASAWLPRLRPLVGPLVLIVLIAFFGALYPGTFLSQQNLLVNILETVSFLIIVAAAQTVVMVVGDFDLSVSGLAALATSFTAAMLATTTLAGEAQDPAFVPLAIGIGLAVGLIGGLVNGVLVAYLGVLAFIATLGMSVVFTNLARFRLEGRTVYGLVEEGFVEVARGTTLGVSHKVWIALIIAGAIWFLLDRTTLGRRMYAVGGNAEASRRKSVLPAAPQPLCGICVTPHFPEVGLQQVRRSGDR